ncbi:MAG: maleylpyruvate isomerase family mycothiol-dependent enzyme [Actinomycetota bacterium]
MQEIVSALTDQHAELDAIVAPLTEAEWLAPTPRCPGWTVSDVVLHLAQTDEMALASVEGRFSEALEAFARGLAEVSSVDDGAGALVEAERGAPPAAVFERWRDSASALRQAFAGCDPRERVQWVVGDMAARTLATTRLAECWIHTGDVLAAFGRPVVVGERLRHIARLAWRTLPYAFASAGRTLAGPVRFELTGPDGEVWVFATEEPPTTTITGPALDLCQVAGQRADASQTALSGSGPDVAAVLELVRTFA